MPAPNINSSQWFAQASKKVSEAIESIKVKTSQLADDASDTLQESAESLQQKSAESFQVMELDMQITPQTSNPIYRWRDAEGNLYFGDHPPEGALELTPITDTETAISY
ncbi:DUF4124 domain-containing protein [bacterium SCSIO 12696]|nr:DUF4124 domain-containing protein [bacterium SCSIO 12696]